MGVPLLDLKAQYGPLREEITAAIADVCDAQYFILGPKVEALERAVADYCGVEAAIGVSSGTDALVIALMALGIGPGDAVLTTPYSFFATVGSIVRVGALPVFADIDPVTFNLAPDAVGTALQAARRRHPDRRIRALMPVHLYGQMADMAPLMDLANAEDLLVIEDACQAIGAEYRLNGRACRAGAMGTAGCFSFFPSKNLGGFGDGGMVTTQDAELGERLKRFRNHGMNPKYYHAEIGGNFRLDALQAAVLMVKLKHLEAWHQCRRNNAARYDALLAGLPVTTPGAVYRGDGLTNDHIYNQYVIRVPERDRVRTELQAAGIGCEVYYPVPLHRQACFAELGYAEGALPVSERAAAETLALPIYPELTEAMQDEVVTALRRALRA
jgi:dTDP-4-amino-4,6-dideoxygalactose transaminase